MSTGASQLTLSFDAHKADVVNIILGLPAGPNRDAMIDYLASLKALHAKTLGNITL